MDGGGVSHHRSPLQQQGKAVGAGGVVTQQGIVYSCEGGELVSWASPSIFD